MVGPDIRLRPLQLTDESAVRAAQQEMAAEGFEFAFGLTEDADWCEYIHQRRREHHGVGLPSGRVPASYLAAVNQHDELVGRSSIRHQLNDGLLAVGGHIGYCVLPQFRRRGAATAILRQSLVIARSVGIEEALLTCDIDNTASRTVIERCGGVLDPDRPRADAAPPKLRYWIR